MRRALPALRPATSDCRPTNAVNPTSRHNQPTSIFRAGQYWFATGGLAFVAPASRRCIAHAPHRSGVAPRPPIGGLVGFVPGFVQIDESADGSDRSYVDVSDGGVQKAMGFE